MKVVPLSVEGLRLGRPLQFSVRDASGIVLLARGAVIETDRQLAALRARPLFIDAVESEAVQRAYNGQLDQLFRQDVALGRIADARPDYRTLEAAAAAHRPGGGGPPLDWPNLQMRLRLLLADPRGADWVARLRAVRDEALALVGRHPDRALMRLVHDAGHDFKEYSASHSLLVCVLVALSAPSVPGWDPQRHDALTLAALSMNVSINALQDELARQQDRPTPSQRAALDAHAARSAEILESLGVADADWLEAVRLHHDAPPGPVTGRPVGEQLARLIRRADRYAARLSPRKSRPASSATVAAQAAFLDEGGHHDEAGQALVKTLGIYPPGVWVQLQCGEVALVLRRTAHPGSPVVASLVTRSGLPFAVPAVRNTKLPSFEVAAAVPPSKVKVRPNLDLLEKL
jgi:HD-GYP domain-containing protein (c-di-GMP phosphodiesterase class II)